MRMTAREIPKTVKANAIHSFSGASQTGLVIAPVAIAISVCRLLLTSISYVSGLAASAAAASAAAAAASAAAIAACSAS